MSDKKTYDEVLKTDKIKAIIEGPDYDFLRTNEHLKGRIMFLTLGGSYAYGMNVPGSDLDIRGCAFQSKTDILGLSNFEQVINEGTDTTVYGFRKLVSLLSNCNPNVIEMLGGRPEHYFMMHPLGQMMIDNRKMFLSKRAVSSFGGYANQQLRRLQNAIMRDSLPQALREEHMRKAMENGIADFERKYTAFPEGAIRLFTDDSPRDDLDREVFADITLRHFPARQFTNMVNDIKNIIDTYEKLNGRNKKKDDQHLNKHAAHLVRLYLMCLDILEKEEIITYREEDHDLLMSIRNGKYMNEDGTYQQEFFDMVNDLEKRLQYAKENTSLPKVPDMKKIEDFVMTVNEDVLAY